MLLTLTPAGPRLLGVPSSATSSDSSWTKVAGPSSATSPDSSQTKAAGNAF